MAHFGAFGFGLERGQRLTCRAVGEDRLLRAIRVVGDQFVGGGQDGRGRTVVLLELEDLRALEVFLEAQDHSIVAAAPRIDRLVVVTDDRNVLVLVGEQRDEPVLREVDVLVLVDQHVAELRLIPHARLIVFFEERDRARDQVVEVEPVGLLEAPLVLTIDLRVALADERGVLLLVHIGRPQIVLRLRDLGEGRARRDLLLVEVEVVKNVADDLPLIGVVHDGEVAGDADLLAVAAQHAHAHRVKRADPEIACRGADHALESRLHLARGLIGKGDREDAIRENFLLVEQVRDAVRKHAGLPGTGPGEDQTRPVGMFDGSALNVVEQFGFGNHPVILRRDGQFGL